MKKNNEIAEHCLYDIMNLFSIRFEDGSRLPGTQEEIDKARERLKKAREAEPDDPEILKWLAETEALINKAPKRKWLGSFLLIIIVLLMIAIVFNQQSRRDVAKLSRLPTIDSIRSEIQYKIDKAESRLERISNEPDTHPKKAERLEAARKELTALQNLDPEKEREKAVSEIRHQGYAVIFLMIYLPLMLILYIFAMRTPMFLIWKRQREHEIIKKSGNIISRIIWGIPRMLIAMGRLSFIFMKPSSRREYPGWQPYRRSPGIVDTGFGEGMFSAFLFFIAALFFLVFVFEFVGSLLIKFFWLIVLVHYMRNYRHEQLDRWKRALKKKTSRQKKEKTDTAPELLQEPDEIPTKEQPHNTEPPAFPAERQQTKKGSRSADGYLDRAFSLFSTRFTDGSRYPGSEEEVAEAKTLLKKARAAEPDNPKTIYRLEEMEGIVSGALKRIWCGSYIIVFFTVIITIYAFMGDRPKHVMNSFNWPTEAALAEQLQNDIARQTQHLEQLGRLPDTNPNKTARIESARKYVEELKKTDIPAQRSRAVQAALWNGFSSLFLMIYSVSMMILYIYTARTPRFLTKKRQQEYEIARDGGDLFIKVVFGISGMLFGIAGALFSQPPTRWVYHEYRDEANGAISGGFFLCLAFIFIWWVLARVADLIACFIWAVVLIQYLRNYRYEWFDGQMEKLKAKYADWKEKKNINHDIT